MTTKRIEEEIGKELGYVSSLFMSQECKGTEIIMPTEELSETLDRIMLYIYTHISQAKQAGIDEAVGKIDKLRQPFKVSENMELRESYNQALDDTIKPLQDNK